MLTRCRAADSERRATAQQAEDEARRRAAQLTQQEVLKAQSNAQVRMRQKRAPCDACASRGSLLHLQAPSWLPVPENCRIQ